MHELVAFQSDEQVPDVVLSLLTGAQGSSGRCEGGAGDPDAGGGGASLRAVTLLQSCSLSPGQKIVLSHNPGPPRPSQRALLCKCVDACGNSIALPSVSGPFMCV